MLMTARWKFSKEKNDTSDALTTGGWVPVPRTFRLRERDVCRRCRCSFVSRNNQIYNTRRHTDTKGPLAKTTFFLLSLSPLLSSPLSTARKKNPIPTATKQNAFFSKVPQAEEAPPRHLVVVGDVRITEVGPKHLLLRRDDHPAQWSSSKSRSFIRSTVRRRCFTVSSTCHSFIRSTLRRRFTVVYTREIDTVRRWI